MNSHSRIHQRPEQNECVFVCIGVHILRSRTRCSPMLGCFSKRQILASLSSFWWSRRKSRGDTNTQVIFNALHYSSLWMAFWIIEHEAGCKLIQMLWRTQVFGHRCHCGCLLLDILTSVCVCWLCVSSAPFLIRTEMLDKNNVTWYVFGYVPQTGRRQCTTNRVSSHSRFLLTSCVAQNAN